MTTKFKTISYLFLGWLFFLSTRVVFAGFQTCSLGDDCTVGEFLFADDYTPITTASCTLTSRKPDESLHLNEVVMTSSSQNDGWYSYTFPTTDLASGTYRAKVCCTASSDHLCLDKTFVVTTNGPTADEIKTAILDSATSEHNLEGTVGKAISDSGTTLNAADIWGYSDRSLTSFGTLAENIWGYSSRSLTSIGSFLDNLTTKTDHQNVTGNTTTTNNVTLNTVNTKLVEQRNLLEKIANTPIIETSIEASFITSLDSKLKQSQDVANKVVTQINTLDTITANLSRNWSNLDSEELGEQAQELLTLIGQTSDKADKPSLSGYLNWVTKAWDNRLTQDLNNQVSLLRNTVTDLKTRTDFYGKGQHPSSLTDLAGQLNQLDALVGTKNSPASRTTFYGYLKYIEDLGASLSQQEKEVNNLLSNWRKTDSQNREHTLQKLRNQVLSFKLIPQSQVLGASTNENPEVTQKNELFNLKALIETSRAILTQFTDQPVQYIWLEEGSIIFKAMITNPSTITSQTVPLKFYFPVEIKHEDIINLDSDLEVHFDADKNAYYVSGDFTLAPNETRTFSIETTDVWQIDLAQIESYRKQAEQLLEPLKKTAYYGQGATIKADIDVALDKIIASQNNIETPENRIRTYRDAQIEINGVEQKIAVLQELVADASSTGSILGFVGGVQTIAISGLIIVVITGFVYLSLYMRALNFQLDRRRGQASSQIAYPTLMELIIGVFKRPSRGSKLASFIFLSLVSASAVTFIGSVYLRVSVLSSTQTNPVVSNNLGSQTLTPILAETTTDPQPQTSKVLGTSNPTVTYFVVKVTTNRPTSIYSSNNKTSPLLTSLTQSQVVSRLKEEGEWSSIEFLDREELKNGWLETKYLTPDPLSNQ